MQWTKSCGCSVTGAKYTAWCGGQCCPGDKRCAVPKLRMSAMPPWLALLFFIFQFYLICNFKKLNVSVTMSTHFVASKLHL
jgi:hypothetical protein